MKTIQFYRKNVYGSEKQYVADPETAKLIASLTRQKTIDCNIKNAISNLFGVQWVEVLPPKNELNLRVGVLGNLEGAN